MIYRLGLGRKYVLSSSCRTLRNKDYLSLSRFHPLRTVVANSSVDVVIETTLGTPKEDRVSALDEVRGNHITIPV